MFNRTFYVLRCVFFHIHSCLILPVSPLSITVISRLPTGQLCMTKHPHWLAYFCICFLWVLVSQAELRSFSLASVCEPTAVMSFVLERFVSQMAPKGTTPSISLKHCCLSICTLSTVYSYSYNKKYQTGLSIQWC